MTKKFLIIAGEASGDLHGSSLIKEMRKIDQNLKFSGIGGDKMIAAGLSASYHIKDMAFLGFFEILKHLPFIKKVKNDLLDIVDDEKISDAILIDYPGFNLNIAKKLKNKGVRIFYYISPQVWAWGENRIKKIKKLVDKMIVVFPFEEEMYLSKGVNAEFVGHPLVSKIIEYDYLPEEEFFTKMNLDNKKRILLLMPGSRIHEISHIFPESIKAASRLADKYGMQIVVACAPNIDENIFSKYTVNHKFTVIKERSYELLKYSHFGIIKSGTSTLEAGLFSLPCVVVYSISRMTYHIMKALIKIDNVAMANIILGETVIPELLQNDLNETNIYNESVKILDDPIRYNNIKEKLSEIEKLLGSKNASRHAAEIILKGSDEQ